MSVERPRIKTREARGRPPLRAASRVETMPQLLVELLCREVEGRAIVIVGSAPLRSPLVVQPGEMVVVVNGAVSSVACVPDFWVVNSRANAGWFSPPRLRLHKLMMDQCTDRHVRTVVFTTRAEGSENVTARWLRERRCTWERSMILTPGGRAWVERESGGRVKGMERHTASLGGTTVAMFLWAGAAQVRVRGFSESAGYAYTDEVIDPRFRGHWPTDVAMMARLSARYGDRLIGAGMEETAL